MKEGMWLLLLLLGNLSADMNDYTLVKITGTSTKIMCNVDKNMKIT